ncbi:MAG: recombination protein RecR [Phototrophicales bacterium]|nr:MAG: recombination protein RecR [Phototrophicales bacterium]RMG70241.1 MAG: recombination protein RecR [Chloroflexota bacterium]
MSNAIPEPVTKLIEAFSRLPGIGPKTASRLTFFLLRAPDELSKSLSDALRDLKTKTTFCTVCYNITSDHQNPCAICADNKRDSKTLVVVEEPLDVLAIERTGSYLGKYHVLHGAISPVDGIGVDDLKIKELVSRVEAGGILEIIIATNPTLEGDMTARYIQDMLNGKGVKVTRLARGLPVGGDLEYVDTVTLTRALQGRSEL